MTKRRSRAFGHLVICHSLRHSSFELRFLFGHRQTDEPIECLTNRVWHKDIEEQLHVKHNDNAGGRPAENSYPDTIREFAHFRLFPRKPHQRPNGKTELHAQYDLTGNEQFRSLAFTENTDD